ncbi:alpha-D-ribose 1-methylphosphonate 5-triphosphate diphosphatase [Acidisoma cellulosilytica]|uniref:Alpha-D-ribose 1-methylphosphonate 5-triphosphate diphosphatase n=1 Tax=Acidisoma cellulosilyticum TaxID=2802395 RepID=A0A963Z0E1_9PROT|nr:alpha-D-ribose 1-methylphosphonate 5-triphosphate diphosphatase [Acidisoma cellulosilyticum]MCB8880390.1 alpha-D-ribose 1-methylphosphonate 5-triphosphate diphosphatase [Acidisoma cellulosilyticum]
MGAELVFTGGSIVLDDRLVEGSLAVTGPQIAAIDTGPSRLSRAIDLDGDLLIPGLIDLHTDNLERQVLPRATARWPSRSAMIAHDAQCAVAGVTTVFDSFCVGDLGFQEARTRTFVEGVADMDELSAAGLLKSEHLLHLRCELPAPDMEALFLPYADHARLALVSLMDHSPGVGQWGDVEKYRDLLRRDGLTEEEVETKLAQQRATRVRWRSHNRQVVLSKMQGRATVLASHDDRTLDDIAENAADGIRIAEFPVTMAAAQAARSQGMQTIAGAPNVVRGGSHSGNVSAADLLRAGAVDAFASDYVPAAMLEAAIMATTIADLSLPQAIALVTDHPARMAGLSDRGRIATGLRADLVRVRIYNGMPIVRGVWRHGERVA